MTSAGQPEVLADLVIIGCCEVVDDGGERREDRFEQRVDTPEVLRGLVQSAGTQRADCLLEPVVDLFTQDLRDLMQPPKLREIGVAGQDPLVDRVTYSGGHDERLVGGHGARHLDSGEIALPDSRLLVADPGEMDQVELGALERSLGNGRVQRQLACLNPQQHFAIELAQGGADTLRTRETPRREGYRGRVLTRDASVPVDAGSC